MRFAFTFMLFIWSLGAFAQIGEDIDTTVSTVKNLTETFPQGGSTSEIVVWAVGICVVSLIGLVLYFYNKYKE